MLRLIPAIVLLTITNLVASSSLEESFPYTVSSQTSSLIRAKAGSSKSFVRLSSESETGQSELYSVFGDSQFVTNLTVGGYDLLVVVDTGSSDTCKFRSNYTLPASARATGPILM